MQVRFEVRFFFPLPQAKKNEILKHHNVKNPHSFVSNLENPIIYNADVNSNGQYLLQVSSVSGCVVTESILITTINSAQEVPTIAAPSICAGEDLILTTSAVGVTYEWIGPSG